MNKSQASQAIMKDNKGYIAFYRIVVIYSKWHVFANNANWAIL